PVVVKPTASLEELLSEFAAASDERHRELLRDQLVVKLRQRARRMNDKAREAYVAEAGEPPEVTIDRLRSGARPEMAEWFKARPKLGGILDWDTERRGGLQIPISHHPDEIESISRGYGDAEKPEDFIESFIGYVRSNENKIAALTIVVQRPRELTRAQLRE